jgi:uncharacterized membrane protein YfcA
MNTSSSYLLILAVAISAFVIGLSKGGLGGTVVSLVTPTLALIANMPAGEAVAYALPLLLVGDVFALRTYWGRWDRDVIIKMMPGTIVGIIIGAQLLSSLSPVTIRHGIGIMVLVYCLYKVIEPRIRQNLAQAQNDTRIWQGSLFGGGAGVASTLANAGGPIASVYLLMERLTPTAFIGTSALYFALVNVMKIPNLLQAGMLQPIWFVQTAWAIPLVIAGVWTGKWLINRLDVVAFERVILVLLSITGFFLLFG